MRTIATAKVQRNYNCYNVYFNECLRLRHFLFIFFLNAKTRRRRVFYRSDSSWIEIFDLCVFASLRSDIFKEYQKICKI